MPTKATLFANVVFVSFSAFDETEPIEEKRDKTKGLQYSYIGLKRIKKVMIRITHQKAH